MTVDRRGVLTAGLGLGGVGLVADSAMAAGRSTAPPATAASPSHVMTSADAGLVPDANEDQSKAMQTAIDQASARRIALHLAPGRYRVNGIMLRSGTRLTGSAAILTLSTHAPILVADSARGIGIADISLDGGMQPPGGPHDALASFKSCEDIEIANVTMTASGARALALEHCSGRIHRSQIRTVKDAAIFALDSQGLDITDNHISECGNNGILVWRTTPGEDGTRVARNRISQISAFSGGSGQNGNAVNVYRAGNVIVEGNRITDCAYSAVRGNAASNLQIIANNCQRIGEVALYAEFAFEGTIISNNVVDGAAAGIAVTNFNEGGRLAVVHGNLIRNLARREQEPVDKRGEGISVEADASVTGNVVDNAPTAGIVIGWGPHMRDVVASGNVVRGAPVGIMISGDPAAGACLVSANLVSGATNGAIRMMEKGIAYGDDLSRTPPASDGRIVVAGNAAV